MPSTKRKLIDDIWIYDDPDEHAFVTFAHLKYGFDVIGFDDYIQSIENDLEIKKLNDWRSKAIEANKSDNYLALEGWLNAMHLAWRGTMKIQYLLPLARAGDKEKKDSRKGPVERLKRDPKQDAKAEIYGEWKKWRTNRGTGRWRASFARAMLEKFTILDSQKTIENWALQWERDTKK